MPLREGNPESIGEYAIESRIGTGGMGVGYLGRSASGRAVAGQGRTHDANEMVLALDLKRGKAPWTTSRELPVFSEPSVRGTTLYATTPDSSIVAINTRTGRERWRTKPAVAADGRESGTVDERSQSPVAPLSVGGVLYAVTDSGPFSVAAGRS